MSYKYSNSLTDAPASFPGSIYTPIEVKNRDDNGYSIVAEPFTIPSVLLEGKRRVHLKQRVLEGITVTILVSGSPRTLVPYGETVLNGQVGLDPVTGILEFHSSDSGLSGTATYTGNGTPIVSHLINTLQNETVAVETTVGSFLDGTGNLNVASITADVFKADSNGTAVAPVYTRNGDTNSGIYWTGTDAIGISTNGTKRFEVTASGTIQVSSESTTTGWINIPSTSAVPGVVVNSANNSGQTGYSWKDNYTNFGATHAPFSIQAGNGSVDAPFFAHTFYFPQVSTSGGTLLGAMEFMPSSGTFTGMGMRFYQRNTSTGSYQSGLTIDSQGHIILLDGTAALPTITFAGDTNSGLYHVAADQIGIATNGVQRFAAHNAGVSVIGALGVTGDANVNSLSLPEGVQFTNPSAESLLITADNTEIDSSAVTITGNVTAANLSGTNTGDQQLFRTIACPAGTNPVADSTTDTLTFAAGSAAITITGNSTTDTITFAVPNLSGTNSGDVSLQSQLDTGLLSLSGQTLQLDIQNANRVFAGPTTGSPSYPTFRSLVDDDIPNGLTITSGTINGTPIGQSSQHTGAFTDTILQTTADVGTDFVVFKFGSDGSALYWGSPFALIWNQALGVMEFRNADSPGSGNLMDFAATTVNAQNIINSNGDGLLTGYRQQVSTSNSATVTVAVSQTGSLITNTYNSAQALFNLPTPATGLYYTFLTTAAAFGMKLKPSGTTTIICPGMGTTTATTGYVTLDTTNTLLKLSAISSTQWVVEHFAGTITHV